MKAVGEVMAIGRSFQEALHKATQSLEIREMDWERTEKVIRTTIQ